VPLAGPTGSASGCPRSLSGRTAREPGALAEHAAARLLRPPDPLGYAYQLYAVAGWSSLRWLHRLPHPSLIVAGEEDPSVALRNARLLAERLPDARLHVVKRGGHLSFSMNPRTPLARSAPSSLKTDPRRSRSGATVICAQPGATDWSETG
jgi:poly(3-hydroxyoctanoate) depolymerase